MIFFQETMTYSFKEKTKILNDTLKLKKNLYLQF